MSMSRLRLVLWAVVGLAALGMIVGVTLLVVPAIYMLVAKKREVVTSEGSIPAGAVYDRA